MWTFFFVLCVIAVACNAMLICESICEHKQQKMIKERYKGGKKVKIVIKNLYGLKDGQKAYFRKQGNGCFDFVYQSKFASELTIEEASDVLKNGDFYKNLYKADEIYCE